MARDIKGDVRVIRNLRGRSLSVDTVEIVTSASNFPLNFASPSNIFFVGTTNGQIVTLGDATDRYNLGHEYRFLNDSEVEITIQDFGANVLFVLRPFSAVLVYLQQNGTSDGKWYFQIEENHYDDFSVLITPPGFQDLRFTEIGVGETIRFELTVLARQTDGMERASFKRVAVFYRNGAGSVLNVGSTWQSVDTRKSDVAMDIQYVLGATGVMVRAKNAGIVSTRWKGHIDIIELS